MEERRGERGKKGESKIGDGGEEREGQKGESKISNRTRPP